MPKNFYKVESYESCRSIGYLLRRSGKLISSRIEALFTEEEVSFVQWVIMMHLRDDLSLTAAELSQNLCHDSGALTRVIDQMEARGLIVRERDLQDRRRIGLKLTREGRKTADSFLPRVLGLYNNLLTDFTAEEANQFISLLTRLIDKLSEAPEA